MSRNAGLRTLLMTSFLWTSKFKGQKASEGSLCKILCLSATEKLKPENAKPSTKAKKRDDKGDISEATDFVFEESNNLLCQFQSEYIGRNLKFKGVLTL